MQNQETNQPPQQERFGRRGFFRRGRDAIIPITAGALGLTAGGIAAKGIMDAYHTADAATAKAAAIENDLATDRNQLAEIRMQSINQGFDEASDVMDLGYMGSGITVTYPELYAPTSQVVRKLMVTPVDDLNLPNYSLINNHLSRVHPSRLQGFLTEYQEFYEMSRKNMPDASQEAHRQAALILADAFTRGTKPIKLPEDGVFDDADQFLTILRGQYWKESNKINIDSLSEDPNSPKTVPLVLDKDDLKNYIDLLDGLQSDPPPQLSSNG